MYIVIIPARINRVIPRTKLKNLIFFSFSKKLLLYPSPKSPERIFFLLNTPLTEIGPFAINRIFAKNCKYFFAMFANQAFIPRREFHFPLLSKNFNIAFFRVLSAS